MMMIILVASLTPVAQCKFRFLSLFFSLNSLQIRSATTVRVGAGAGAHAACEQIGCWAGVEVNFKSLLYVAQHANEKKNRDSVCMLGWSCSNKTSIIAACHVLDPIDHVLDPIAIARPPGPGAGRRPYVQPSAHRHRPRHTTHVDVATPPVRAAPMPMPMHAHADGRRCARSSLCADPSVCQRSRRLSQRLLFRFRRALSAVSGGAVRCVLQPAACCLLPG